MDNTEKSSEITFLPHRWYKFHYNCSNLDDKKVVFAKVDEFIVSTKSISTSESIFGNLYRKKCWYIREFMEDIEEIHVLHKEVQDKLPKNHPDKLMTNLIAQGQHTTLVFNRSSRKETFIENNTFNVWENTKNELFTDILKQRPYNTGPSTRMPMKNITIPDLPYEAEIVVLPMTNIKI